MSHCFRVSYIKIKINRIHYWTKKCQISIHVEIRVLMGEGEVLSKVYCILNSKSTRKWKNVFAKFYFFYGLLLSSLAVGVYIHFWNILWSSFEDRNDWRQTYSAVLLSAMQTLMSFPFEQTRCQRISPGDEGYNFTFSIETSCFWYSYNLTVKASCFCYNYNLGHNYVISLK